MKSLEKWGEIAGLVYSCSHHNYLDKVGDNFPIELAKKPSVPFLKVASSSASRMSLGASCFSQYFMILVRMSPLILITSMNSSYHRHSRCDRHRVPMQGRSAELFQPPAGRLWRRKWSPCSSLLNFISLQSRVENTRWTVVVVLWIGLESCLP